MRTRPFRFVLFAFPLLTLGCLEKASVPPVRQGVDATSKERIYEDYALTHDKQIFSETWVRKDGSYNIAELENVIEQYPESREVRHSLMSRRFVLATVGGIGAGIVGFTLGFNISANQENRMSSSTQTTLYVTGGSLVLASIIMEIAWRDPAEDLADAYNHALARDLGITPGSAPIPGGPPPVHGASSSNGARFVIVPTAIAGARGDVHPGLGGALVF